MNVLAIDLGASSGRAILGRLADGKIELTEVHRFANNPVMLRGTLYWDILAIFHEIKRGMEMARNHGGFDSIGIDAWGVDFGLLDESGALIENPVHYRDSRAAGITDEICGIIGRDNLYNATGIQFLDINTLCQMYALKKYRPYIFERAKRALMIPDLLTYFLTGVEVCEYSAASTTQMLDPYTRKWNAELLADLGIPQLFPEVRESGFVSGVLGEDIRRELGLDVVPVISVAGHDTASAVMAAPSELEDFMYISCGTWSLFGTEESSPVINEKSLLYSMTNEGGYGGKTRFLKNIAGLWLIQETRRQYAREGKDYSYADMEALALESKPFASFIDPDAPEFTPPGDIPGRIREFCARTGQKIPQTAGETVRCIYESIAMKYKHVYSCITSCTGKQYNVIHMLGGGVKDKLLCQMASNATGLPVTAGPVEATALGNIAAQLITLGAVSGIKEARGIIRGSFKLAEYRPCEREK